jgi:hypothetical protein
MKTARQYPGVFHRVFLSHLVLLLVVFIAAVLLFFYMVAPGTAQYFIRNPAIIIPSVLALMGIAGLLSLWTASAIAVPLDRSTEALKSLDFDELRTIMREAGSEEMHALLEEIAACEQRADDNPFRSITERFSFIVLETDTHLNIRSIDPEGAAQFELTNGDHLKRNFRDLVSVDARTDASPILYALRTPGEHLVGSWLTMQSSSGRRFFASWYVTDRTGSDGLFAGKLCVGLISRENV